MTNTSQNQPDRLDRIEATLDRVATRLVDLSVSQASTQQQIDDLALRQSSTQQQIDDLALRQSSTQQQIDDLAVKQANTQQQLDDLTSTANSIFARDVILNDVLLELRDSHEQHERSFEQHQRNFEEHQRTTNAALERLEAILLQLIRNSQ